MSLVGSLPTLADGIPTADALVYGGVAFGASGAVLAGVPVNVSLWDVANGGTPTDNKKCEAVAPGQTDAQGRFRVSLAGCVSAVSQNPNLFAEVTVNGVALPRSKLSASPYAIEALRASTTSQILTGNITVSVNPAGGAQFTTLQDAWAWVKARVVRGKLTIQLANGSYTLPGLPFGLELDHPDGMNISIIGNTTAPQAVTLNGAVRLEGTKLFLINGVRLVGPGTANSVGINVFYGGAMSIGPNVRIENFALPIQVEGKGQLAMFGGSISCSPSAVGMASNTGSHVQADAVSVTGCSTAFQSGTGSHLICSGCIANTASVGWSSVQGGTMSANASQATGVTTTFFAAAGGMLFVSSAPAGATYSPALNVLGNRNGLITE